MGRDLGERVTPRDELKFREAGLGKQNSPSETLRTSSPPPLQYPRSHLATKQNSKAGNAGRILLERAEADSSPE